MNRRPESDTDRRRNRSTVFISIRAYRLFEDASPITHLSAGDPPVFMFYSQPNEPLPPEAKPGAGIHHPRFGFLQKYFPCGTLRSCSFTAPTSMPGITREIQRRYGRGVCDQSTENEAVAGLAEPPEAADTAS